MSEQPFSLLSCVTTFDSSTKTWSGPDVYSLNHPKVSVGEILIRALRRCPHNVGQISHEDGYEMKNWEILRDSIRTAISLRNLGLHEGDVLGFAAGNSRDYAAIVIGALLNGNPVHTISQTFEAEDIIPMYMITQPKIVVCDEDNYPHVKDALQVLNNPAPIFVFDNSDNTEVSWKSVRELLKPQTDERKFICPRLSNGEELPAFIQCTSGTTGPPKAVPYSHTSLAYGLQEPVPLPPSLRIFSFAPLYSMNGVINLLRTTVSNTIRVIVRRPLSVPLLLEILKDRQIQFFGCSPAQLQLLFCEQFDCTEDLKSLNSLAVGGGSLSPSTAAKFKIPIMSGYAFMEGGAITSGGLLVNGVTLKIVDDDGQNLGVGERGEICVRPRFPFRGYYGESVGTKVTLKDGFLHSGDLGFVDENGKLNIIDRMKDMFKFDNYDVSPSEVEIELQTLEGVGLISVVAIPHEVHANLPAAVIQRKKGSKLSELDVHTFAKANLASYKWLRGGVYFVDAMPFTISGKIIRRKTAELAIGLFAKSSKIGFNY